MTANLQRTVESPVTVEPITTDSIKTAKEKTTVAKAARLFFIDRFRSALTLLVVLHHVAVVYGEGISFYYVEPANMESLTYLVLLVFVLANQGWFMGAFFLLAGYFTPGSYDRKGSGAFLKDRLLRLGIPLIVWLFVLGPITSIGMYLEPSPRIPDPLTWQNYWQAYPYLLGLGPLWFVALLLIFSFGYAAWRMVTPNRESSVNSNASLPSYLSIGIFTLALAVVSYLVRIIVPLGKSVNLFVDFLDFPTLAYLPQCLSFFVLGTIASRHDWFRRLPGSIGTAGFVAVIVAFILLFPLAFLSGLKGQFLGYGQWQSAVYALWDSIFAVGLCLGYLTLFRRLFDKESRLGTFLARQSYAVYILHSPIIVLVAVALKGVELEHFLKFGLVSVIVIPLCFVVAYVIRKIPGVSRIL
ncbi:acyltransferase family protein [Chloroflexi bacterium TSY]|nr:acyltransferase family protein [Chloroflexi bacterium TSY]